MPFHKQRREERIDVALEAILEVGDRDISVTLVNAASGGVLALLDTPPPRGTAVSLRVAGRHLDGQVRWRGADRCGIAFREPIDVAALQAGRLLRAGPLPMAHPGDSYRGPRGFLRTILDDAPPSGRVLNLAFLVLALLCTLLAISRLSTPPVTGLQTVSYAPFD
ncbi:PilZ domain-containing protein [Novosphingobium sp. BW1]|uniref:PilZ domain-containing protein n=1 Tax=Novosphingobium sp. BW1 TaxID=2592621 RepID=UPI0011DE8D95|nr:PilZ domain-containing protein [Novosphingobium sp. BW1]TYC92973.1 PilZ domain-containing protein [Novosphingobium sp. BW1]